MSVIAKFGSLVVAAGLLAGCTEPAGFGTKTLAKGEQIGIRALVAAHPGQVACSEYNAVNNSCASLLRARISGDTLIGSETVFAKDITGGAPQRIEIVTRSRIQGNKACVTASGISVGAGSQNKQLATFVVGFTKDLVQQSGGVCGTYYRSGDGYVVSSVGGNGQPFPPGDTAISYVSGSPKLRAQ